MTGWSKGDDWNGIHISNRVKGWNQSKYVRLCVHLCRRETDRKTASGQRLGWRRAAGNRCVDYICNIWSILMYNSPKAIEGMAGERRAQRQCETECTEGCVTAERRTESWILIFVAEQMKVLNQNDTIFHSRSGSWTPLNHQQFPPHLNQVDLSCLLF